MGKMKREKGRVIDAAFRQEAVRILVTSGRTIKTVAEDLGVGVSSLGTWKRKSDRAELIAGPHEDVEKELARQRRWRTAFTTREQAAKAIGQCIEGFYNPRRRHSSLGYISPAPFEAQHPTRNQTERIALY
jgi:transposase